MKTIFIIGDDKLGHAAVNDLGRDEAVWLNDTLDLLRVFKLARIGAISPLAIIKMAIANRKRQNVETRVLPSVKTNNEVKKIINTETPDRVVCFRAGLVLNRSVLGMGPQFLNVHCAELPEFSGLGALPRALRANRLQQNACLHQMSTKIDSGRVLAREPFLLLKSASYRENEDLAYSAGRKLLTRIAKGEILS